MTPPANNNPSFFNLTHYTFTLLGVWSFIIIGLLYKEYHDNQSYTMEIATNTAQAHLDKDKSFRFWGTAHGGVYVPITSSTPTNPYLETIEEHELTTPSGKKLTLMNPEYMVRHMNETFSHLYGVSGHITSLSPLRPENGPDDWEKKALHQFELGEEKVLEVTGDGNGERILRLMEPLYIETGCLKCHDHQGDKVGNIRGGVGVNLPLAPFVKETRKIFIFHSISLLFLWLLGCALIVGGSQSLRRRTLELAASNFDLKSEVEERKKTEKLFQKENIFNAAIQDTAGALIMVLDMEGKIIRFNQTCEKISGYDTKEARNQYFWKLLLPKKEAKTAKEQFQKTLKAESPHHYEATLVTKNGSLRIIEWTDTTFWDPSNEVEYLISTGIDITEAKQLHAQLLHAEKLTAVGRLSASIAHEINNPLFGIKNVLERLKEKASLNEENQEFAELALQECDRIKNLILDLQEFNRPSSEVVTSINIHKFISNMLLLSKKELKQKNIEVVTKLSPEVSNIPAIADQIKQVLLNLLNNAIEAMPTGGTITISTSLVQEKQRCSIILADTGAGIKDEDMQHIFEPFFTTKAAVKGTGLGLSISYGIVENHGGEIAVESFPGKGTKFIISLPIESQLV